MTDSIKIEFFTTASCKRCAAAKRSLLALIDELGAEKFSYRELDIVEEVDYAVELGVLNSSSIAIDGKLIFGSMPSTKKLRAALRSSVSNQAAR